MDVTSPAGWTTTHGKNVTGGYTGRWSWQLSGASSLAQIANPANGTYTLSAWIKGTGAPDAELYAQGSNGSKKTISLSTAGTTWTKMSVTGIEVTDGRCEIGVTATSGTITVDDFGLVHD